MAEEIEEPEDEVPRKNMTTLEFVSAVIIFLMIAGSVFYANVKNTITLSNPFLAGLFVVAFVFVAVPSVKLLRVRQLDAFRAAGSFLIMLFIAAGVSISLWSVLVSALGFYEYTTTKVDVPVLTSIAIVFGTGLWKIRVFARAFYGCVEVVAGVGLTAFNALNNADSVTGPSPQLYAAVLTGGIFLIVRGLDNMEQGLKYTAGKYADTWVQWLSNRIDRQVRMNKRAVAKLANLAEAAAKQKQDLFNKQRANLMNPKAQSSRLINSLDGKRGWTVTTTESISDANLARYVMQDVKLDRPWMDSASLGDGSGAATGSGDGAGGSESVLTQHMSLVDYAGNSLTADEFNNLALAGKLGITAFSRLAPVSYEESQKGTLRLQNQHGAWVSINEFNDLPPPAKSLIRAVYDKQQ